MKANPSRQAAKPHLVALPESDADLYRALMEALRRCARARRCRHPGEREIIDDVVQECVLDVWSCVRGERSALSSIITDESVLRRLVDTSASRLQRSDARYRTQLERFAVVERRARAARALGRGPAPACSLIDAVQGLAGTLLRSEKRVLRAIEQAGGKSLAAKLLGVSKARVSNVLRRLRHQIRRRPTGSADLFSSGS